MKFSAIFALALTYTTLASAQSFRKDNADKAEQLAKDFAKLTPDTPCSDIKQACVDKKFAQCVNGKFVSTACGSGLQCEVLPLVNSPGTSITCTTEADRKARLDDARKSAAGNKQPDAGNKQPDAGSKQPDAGSKQPDGGNKQPDGGNKQPDAGNKQPDNGMKKPGNEMKQPGDGKKGDGKKGDAKKGDAKKGDAKKGDGKKGDGKKQPDNGMKQPDNGSNQPDDTKKPADSKAPTGIKKTDTGSESPKSNNLADIRKKNADEAEAQQEKFKTLNENSKCTDGENACVGDKFAQCANGKFALTACGSGLKCASLPLVLKEGTSVTCTTESDRVARLDQARKNLK